MFTADYQLHSIQRVLISRFSNFNFHPSIVSLNQLSRLTSIRSIKISQHTTCQGAFSPIVGSAKDKWIKVVQHVKLVQGYNDIQLLSEMEGLQIYGACLEKYGASFKGQMKLTRCKNGEINLTAFLWTYQEGLKGEFLKVYNVNSTESAGWTELPNDAIPSVF